MYNRMENAMEHQMESDMLRNEAAYMDSRGNHMAATALRMDAGIERVEAFGAAINPFSHHHHHHGGMGAGLAQMELAREQQMMMGGMGVGYGGVGVGMGPGYYPPAGGVYPMGGMVPPGQVTTVTEITTTNNGFQPGFVPGAAPYGPGYMGAPGCYPPGGAGYYPPY